MPTHEWVMGLAGGVLLVGPCWVAPAQAPASRPGGPVVPAPAGSCHGLPAAGVAGTAQPCRPARPAWWARCKTSLHDNFLGHLAEFESPPLGLSLTAHYQAHISNALAPRLTMHDYDFACGTEALNYRGRDRVREIALLLPQTQFPVVVERLPLAPALAEARRRAVLAEFATAGVQVPPERVIVGPSPTDPLRGVEAELIFQNLMIQTRSAGTLPGTGVGTPAGGATGGSGPGGGGPGGQSGQR